MYHKHPLNKSICLTQNHVLKKCAMRINIGWLYAIVIKPKKKKKKKQKRVKQRQVHMLFTDIWIVC